MHECSYIKTVSNHCQCQSRAAEEEVWVQGGGIVIPCMYILHGRKMDRPYVRGELKKSARKKRSREAETDVVQAKRSARQ